MLEELCRTEQDDRQLGLGEHGVLLMRSSARRPAVQGISPSCAASVGWILQ
jgi:hypothetical protein